MLDWLFSACMVVITLAVIRLTCHVINTPHTYFRRDIVDNKFRNRMTINSIEYADVVRVTIQRERCVVTPDQVFGDLTIAINGDYDNELQVTSGNIIVNGNAEDIRLVSGTIQVDGSCSRIDTKHGKVEVKGLCHDKVRDFSGSDSANQDPVPRSSDTGPENPYKSLRAQDWGL